MPSLADYINPRSPAWDAWRSDMDAPRPEMPQPQGEISYRQGPWYERAPQALADYLYGPNATMQQVGSLAKYLGPENPLNIPGQFHQGLNTALGGYAAREPLTLGAGLLTAGMAVAPGPKGPKPTGIRAYHGSPHSFDRFDTSKVGIGEGAQVYGHGLYFAESEGVAKYYKQKLSKTDPGHMYEVNIKADPEHFLDWDKPLKEQSQYVRDALKLDDKTSIVWKRNKVTDATGIDELAEIQNVRDGFRAVVWGLRDEPTFRTHAEAKAYIENKLSTMPRTSDWGNVRVDALVRSKNPYAEAKEMRQRGIAGIRYLDQGSRAGGEGTRNLVVFDDSLIEILRKYGLYPAAGLGAATAYDQQQRPQEAY